MISELKQRALHRTKIIEGQIRGLAKKIEDEEYCMDILTQSLAIQKSLSSLNKLIVENHIRTHIKDKLPAKGGQQHLLDELLALYELNNRRGRQ